MNDLDSPQAQVDAEQGAGGGPRRPRRPRRTSLAIVLGAALVVAAAALVLVYGPRIGGRSASFSTAHPNFGSPFGVVQSSGLSRPASTSAIAGRVDPGLVNINVADGSTGLRGSATGMVLTPSGVVLTNNHVIRGATTVRATDVGNGKTYTGTVVGYDRTGDVAVIQLQGASGLQTVPLGDSSALAVGARVTALGNAGGGGGTPRVARGSVTALGRTITASDFGGVNAERLFGLIQTNAAVRPGDSGGPLVNDAGQVVGMDAAASSGNVRFTSRSSVQAFAIPVNTALAIVKQVEAGVSSATVHIGPTGFLGVEVVPPSPFGRGSASAGPQPRGAPVGGVLPGYPAARIGLAKGDVITAVDGQTVASATALTGLLSSHHPGDLVHLQWTDSSGQTHSAAVTLASGPPA